MNREISTVHRFPSKLLLFGEHTVVFGSKALAIPYPEYFGKWSVCNEKSSQEKKLLNEFLDFLIAHCSQFLSLEKLLLLQKSVLFFESNIPYGFGLGSSGALCAAIYDYCAIETESEIIIIKKHLSAMESYFHGSSSGLDPLISYLNKPILIGENQTISVLNQEFFTDNFYLWNSKTKRKASVQIQLFAEKMKDIDFQNKVNQELIPINEACIQSFIQKDITELTTNFEKLSRFQLKYMDFLIPEATKAYWEKGLSDQTYFMKICGAGGGGFFLGLKNKPL